MPFGFLKKYNNWGKSDVIILIAYWRSHWGRKDTIYYKMFWAEWVISFPIGITQ